MRTITQPKYVPPVHTNNLEPTGMVEFVGEFERSLSVFPHRAFHVQHRRRQLWGESNPVSKEQKKKPNKEKKPNGRGNYHKAAFCGFPFLLLIGQFPFLDSENQQL